jgi:hypothetical protein
MKLRLLALLTLACLAGCTSNASMSEFETIDLDFVLTQDGTAGTLHATFEPPIPERRCKSVAENTVLSMDGQAWESAELSCARLSDDYYMVGSVEVESQGSVLVFDDGLAQASFELGDALVTRELSWLGPELPVEGEPFSIQYSRPDDLDSGVSVYWPYGSGYASGAYVATEVSTDADQGLIEGLFPRTNGTELSALKVNAGDYWEPDCAAWTCSVHVDVSSWVAW